MAITKVSRNLLNTGVSDSSDATAITITSDENVGIGTTTINTGTLGPNNTFLEVAAGTNSGSGTLVLSRTTSGNNNEVGGLRFVNSDNADDDGLDSDGKLVAAISARAVTSDSNAGDDSGADLVVYTKPEAGNYAERMRISSNGNVGIGNAGPHQKLMVTGPIVLTGALSGLGAAGNYTYGALDGTALDYYGDNARSWSWGSSSTRGTFTWYQLENDGQNQITSMTLNSNGTLLVGKTADNTTDVGVVVGDGYVYITRSANVPVVLNRTTNHGHLLDFRQNNVNVGNISTNGHSLPSDKNFKKNISDLDLGLNLVTKLKPSKYNYKIQDEDSPIMYGLIAQDVEESLAAVGIEKNSTHLLQHKPKDDENESDYELDYLKLMPVLINAIQEQQAIIEDLQTQINEVKHGN